MAEVVTNQSVRMIERNPFDYRLPASGMRVDIFHRCPTCRELFASVIALWGHTDAGECPPTAEGWRAGLTYTAWEPPSGRYWGLVA